MTEQEEKQAIKEVLFDYNAETIEFADEIADRILRKLNERFAYTRRRGFRNTKL